jgi:hypothetical protein
MLNGYGKRTGASGVTGWATGDGSGSGAGEPKEAVSGPEAGGGTTADSERRPQMMALPRQNRG